MKIQNTDAQVIARISRIVRAVRKQNGISQQELAKSLQLTQSALSRIESGTQMLSVPEWVEFCKLTGVPADCLITGFIDRSQIAEYRETVRAEAFSLPQKYCVKAASLVRTSLPLLDYFQKVMRKKTANYFKTKNIDPDYFVFLDNPINLEFYLDIARTLVEAGKLKVSNIPKMTQGIADSLCHGSLQRQYDSRHKSALLLSALLHNSKFYECNFNYKIEDQTSSQIVLSISPHQHVQAFNYKEDSVLRNFVCEFKKGYFLNFVRSSSHSNEKRPVLKEVECHFRKSTKCVYRISNLQ